MKTDSHFDLNARDRNRGKIWDAEPQGMRVEGRISVNWRIILKWN
jgi:hypothetical protein